MCTFGLSGCRVNGGPTRPGRRGSHTTARELQTCTFEGSGASKHQQNSTRRPPEREKKNENEGGRGKKKREIWAPHPSGAPPLGAPPFGAPPFLGLGPHPSGPHPSGAPPFGGPTLRGPTFSWFGPPPFEPPPTTTQHTHTHKKPEQLISKKP